MVMDMLTIYLHYEDGNQEVQILQRSMMRHHVSYYDLILMTEEVGFQAIDFLYYAKKDPQGNSYLVHIDDHNIVSKMLSDLETEKTIHLYVSKEKAGNDVAPPNNQNVIAPSNHPNDSILLHDDGVSAEGAEQPIMRRPQRQVRRSKRLNVIQIADQRDDEDGNHNNGEQYITPGDESQALEDEVSKRKRTSLPIVWNMPMWQRIVVKCNEESQPIGEEGAILGKFLGTIATNGGYCPLDKNDWRGVKKNRGEEMILQCVKRQADPEKKRPHRAKVYLATHKKNDNATNKDKNERLDRLESLIAERPELAQNVNGRVAWEGDALLKVLGGEKTGQVHGMGLLPTPKQAYGRTPRYLKNINMTTTDGSPCEGEADVWEELAKLKEQIRRQDQIIEDRNNKEKEGSRNIGIEEEENLQSNDNGISRLPILHGKTKRVQCNGPIEARSSMQHDMIEDNNLLHSREKNGEHDNVNQLLIQHNSSSPQDLVIDSVPEKRKTRDRTGELSSRLEQQGTKNQRPHSVSSKRRRTSSLKVGSEVVLKTSTYPNKRNVAYATIQSTDPTTKASGIELGAEFVLVCIDETILDNEELVREVSDCKTIGDAFASGFLIAWPSAFIRKKDV